MAEMFTIYPDVAIAKRRRAHVTLSAGGLDHRWFNSLSEALMEAYDDGVRDILVVCDSITFKIKIDRVIDHKVIVRPIIPGAPAGADEPKE